MSSRTDNLGYKVTARDINWLQLVERAWGSEFLAPDHSVYEWSNGRKFDSTDKWLSGLYGVDCPLPFEFEYHYPDVDTTLMVSDQSSNELIYIDGTGGPTVAVETFYLTTEDSNPLLTEAMNHIRY